MATALADFQPIRAPYNSSTAPSVADSLPALNFGFDELRARMSMFTQRFDDFIEKGRKRVLEERNQFRMSVAHVQEEHHQRHRSIALLTTKTHHHAQTLASQSAEAAEMHAAIASLTATRTTHATALAATKSRLAATRSQLDARRAAHRKVAARLARQAAADGPELAFWEEYLGLRVEGTGVPDRVRFVFVGCGGRGGDGEGEAWFELEVGGKGRGYEVVGSEPRVEGERVEGCVARMTGEGGEDLAGFLKGMREVFMEEMGGA